MSLRPFIAAFLLLATLAASEEKPLPKEIPPYGADRPIPVPHIAQKTLPNGLTLWLVKRSGLPKVNLFVAIRGGMAHDPSGLEGASNLLAATLTEGTATRSSRRIAEELQAVGGELSAFESPDATYLKGSALSDGLGTLVQVAADVVLRASFPGKEVELAKANALQGLKAAQANPAFQANSAFAAAVYREHPYRRVTALEPVIQAVTPSVLKQLRGRRFDPARTLLVLAGDFEEEAASKLLTRAFGEWKAAGAGEAPIVAPSSEVRREILLVDRPGSVQATLRIGRPGVSAAAQDMIPLALANVILGGSFDSRITKNIREEKGYTYSPGSYSLTRQLGGSFQVRADVRNEVAAASLMEIFYELDRMGTTPLPESELERAKRYVAGIYLFQNQLQVAVAATLATNWVNGLPPEFLGSYVDRVKAVTAEQVRAVGGKYFASKDQAVVVVGDAAKVRPELEHFGPVKAIKP